MDRDEDGGASRQAHFPTRPVDREKAEQELSLNIKKAMSLEEAAPKQKHVRSQFPRPDLLVVLRLIPPSTELIVYTWDYHSSASIWSGLRIQPILSDEVQTFKALITVHKLLQEGHPIVRRSSHWLTTLTETAVLAAVHQGSSKSNWMARNLRKNNRWRRFSR